MIESAPPLNPEDWQIPYNEVAEPAHTPQAGKPGFIGPLTPEQADNLEKHIQELEMSYLPSSMSPHAKAIMHARILEKQEKIATVQAITTHEATPVPTTLEERLQQRHAILGRMIRSRR
ncbi:MAG: hypothetical protein JWO41_428 [Candidatus Saccharibacteria bacterium]|nr:hypothetical protein [Candidatus Saccharibacteria bacterium]